MKNWYSHLKVPYYSRALWVIGPTGCGKSTVAKELSKNNIPILECGKWARLLSDSHDVEVITKHALNLLKKDHRVFSVKIKEELSKLQIHEQIIVAGSRNPIDFVDNFNPEMDGVIFLNTELGVPATLFEDTGIKTIMAYVKFLYSSGIMSIDHLAFFEPVKDLD